MYYSHTAFLELIPVVDLIVLCIVLCTMLHMRNTSAIAAAYSSTSVVTLLELLYRRMYIFLQMLITLVLRVPVCPYWL
jgi:K+ transporter